MVTEEATDTMRGLQLLGLETCGWALDWKSENMTWISAMTARIWWGLVARTMTSELRITSLLWVVVATPKACRETAVEMKQLYTYPLILHTELSKMMRSKHAVKNLQYM